MQIPKSPRQGNLVLQFQGRSDRSVQKSQIVGTTLTTTAFGDIAGYRHRSPANLGCQTVYLVRRPVAGMLIDPVSELVRESESIETTEVLHRACPEVTWARALSIPAQPSR